MKKIKLEVDSLEECYRRAALGEIQGIYVAQYQIQVNNQLLENNWDLNSLDWKKLLIIHLEALRRADMEQEYGYSGLGEWKSDFMLTLKEYKRSWEKDPKKILYPL